MLDYLLADRAAGSLDPILLGSTMAAALAIIAGIWQRRLLLHHPYAGADYHVFRMDAADALRAWGAAQLLAGLAWLVALPRLDMPLWSYLLLGQGLAAGLVALGRWRVGLWRDRPHQRAHATHGDPGPRAMSETWEYALMAAAISGGVTYVVGLVIPVHQPVHLAVMLLEAVGGYAVGLVIWSPRTRIRPARIDETERAEAAPSHRRHRPGRGR